MQQIYRNKLESGRTNPDILLFTDRISGIVFNGWELKFPDTRVDDREMLENALEKAKRLKSNSFVTWNGAEAVIWKIDNSEYTFSSLLKIKEYPREPAINSRDDLADPVNFNRNEHLLRDRVNEILYDLEQLYERGELKQAINITGNIIEAIIEASSIIIPQFQNAIIQEKGNKVKFRRLYNQWKIYESSTLKILASSSRRPEKLIEEEVLAKFAFYNLIGKILFYLTLSENLKSDLTPFNIEIPDNLKAELDNYFEKAKSIDYQAIFKPYFTDNLPFSELVKKLFFN